MPSDQWLIEDYIPIEAISTKARREKSIRKGHASTLHPCLDADREGVKLGAAPRTETVDGGHRGGRLADRRPGSFLSFPAIPTQGAGE